jgi:hypothetical protein
VGPESFSKENLHHSNQSPFEAEMAIFCM